MPPADSDESLVIRSPDHARQEAARDDVRLLVIVIDDYHLKYGSLEDVRLRRDLVRFIQHELRPLDLVAVMGPLTPLSDLELTRDRAELIRRVNKLEGRLGGFVPPRSAIEEGHLRLGAGQLARVRAQISLSALQAAVVHLAGLREGRKSILFVSQGPPIRADGTEMFSELRDVIAAANRGNVTVHTLDPRQLGDARRISDANEALAAETGGRRMGLANDFTRGLQSVMSDASAYYLLGYQSLVTEADGKFRKIQVRVKRERARVIARNGYWAPRADELRTAAAAAAAPRVPAEVAFALDTLRDQGRRAAVTDWIGFSPVADGQSDLTIVLEPIASAGTPEVGVIEIEMTWPGGTKTTHAAARDGDGWMLRLQTSPGTVRARVVVQDTAGETLDTWVRELLVPGASDTAGMVGTPAVYRATNVLQYRALAAGTPVLPTAVRRFRRTDRAIVRLPITADGAPVDVQLLNMLGVPLRTLPAVAAPVPAAVQVEVPLGNLAQADYLVRFLVTSGTARTSRLVPFTLTP
jgi:VWFA-related protein